MFLLFDVKHGIVQQFFTVSYIVGVYGSRILIFNLIAYVFLRGFWIGIVAYLPIQSLPPKPHLLTVEKQRADMDGSNQSEQSSVRGLVDVDYIPFVKE